MASYVAPGIKDKFETLSTDLKNLILERNVELNKPEVFYDLVNQINARKTEREEFVEQIVEEGEAE